VNEAIIISLFNLLGIAITSYFSYKAHLNSREAKTIVVQVRSEVEEAKDAILEVKKHTNQMKDELVAATERMASAEGNLQGRSELKAEQDSK